MFCLLCCFQALRRLAIASLDFPAGVQHICNMSSVEALMESLGGAAVKTNLHACVFRRVWLSSWATVGLGRGGVGGRVNPVLGDRFLGNAPTRKTERRKLKAPEKKGKKGTEKKENPENSERGPKTPNSLFFPKRTRHSKNFRRNYTERRCSSSGRSPF